VRAAGWRTRNDEATWAERRRHAGVLGEERLLPSLNEHGQHQPRDARPDGPGPAQARLSPHGKFLLEPLEPRVLLSADSILGEVYRSLVDDEARSIGAEFAVIVQEIDAATSAEISAVDGNGFGSAQAQTAPSVAWPEGWQTDPEEQTADDAEALPAVAPETTNAEDLQAAQFAAAAVTSTATENQRAGDDSTPAGSDDQDANSGIIPGTHLPRGPPANDQPSAAVIADESLADKELSLSDSPQGDEGGLFGVEGALISETFYDSQARAPPDSGVLYEQSVAPVLAEALRLWTATGLTQDQADRLAQIEVRVADLPGAQLGWAEGLGITLDHTAAGLGWFVDPTPGEHSEFTQTLSDFRIAADADSTDSGRIDLLTVVLHEIGHVLGFDHLEADESLGLMSEILPSGTRRLPDSIESAALEFIVDSDAPTRADHDQHLLFDGPAAPDAGVTPIDILADSFNAVLLEARDLWTVFANGAGVADVLTSFTVELMDLEDNELAQAQGGVISLDPTAAGRGWFVDPTPADNGEFDTNLLAVEDGSADGLIDLLTVLVHEVGHLLGFPHGSQLEVMDSELGLGERSLLSDLMIVDLSGVADTAIVDIQINDNGTVDISGAGPADGTALTGIALVIGNPNASFTLGGSNLDNQWTLGAGNTGHIGSATSFVAFQAIQLLEGGAAQDQVELRSGYSALTTLSTGGGPDRLLVVSGSEGGFTYSGGADLDSIVNADGAAIAIMTVDVETRIDRPLLFIPGFAGTFAKDQTESGIKDWFLRRGIEAWNLALEPLGRTYDNFVQTMVNLGYVNGTDAPAGTIFAALWDWRTPVAISNDLVDDGFLADVTTASLMDATFDSGVDYLAYWLDKAAQAWETLTGTPATGVLVDVVTHSTGGLVSRAYIQSAAYGDGLPRINTLIQTGVPNQGTGAPFQLLNNDFSLKSGTRVLTLVIDKAYSYFNDPAETVLDPDGTPFVIHHPDGTPLDLGTATEADKQKYFVGSYVQALLDLLPVYPAYSTDDGVSYATLTDAGQEFVNPLLGDLNAGNGRNGFADPYDAATNPNAPVKTRIMYGTGLDTADRIWQQQGFKPDLGLSNEILPFTKLIGDLPDSDQIWYHLDPLPGDETVTELSASTGFDGSVLMPRADTEHSALSNDAGAQEAIVAELGVTTAAVATAAVSTDLKFGTLQSAVKLVEFGLIEIGPIELGGLTIRVAPVDTAQLVDLLDDDGELTTLTVYAEIQLDAFVYLAGQFTFEKLPEPQLIDISTGLPANAVELVTEYGSEIEDIVMKVTKVSGRNIQAFVGINGPFWTDLDDDQVPSFVNDLGETLTADGDFDGFVDEVGGYGDKNKNGRVDPGESAEIDVDATGLVIENLDVALAMFKPDLLGTMDPAYLLIPKMHSLVATAQTARLVGMEAVVEATIRNIKVTVNSGKPWKGGFGPPVVNIAKSFENSPDANDGELAFFSPVGELAVLDADQDGWLELDDIDPLEIAVLAALTQVDLNGNDDGRITPAELLALYDLGDGLGGSSDGRLQESEASALAVFDDNGDDEIQLGGFQEATGELIDPLVIDFDGSRRLGASADSVLLSLANFVHVIGSFSFEKGPVHRVDVATGLPANLGDLVVALQDAFGDLPFTDPADGTLWVEPDLSVIHNLEVDSLQIGASGANAFVGLNGPYRPDTNGDGFVTDADGPADPDAVGLAIEDVDFGFITMSPTLNSLPGFNNLLPKFTAIKATAASAGLVGMDEVLTASIRNVLVEVNTGKKWPGELGPPVVDFASSFATDEVTSFFDADGDGAIEVSDLLALAAGGAGALEALGFDVSTPTQVLEFADLLAVLDGPANGNQDGQLQVTEASLVAAGAAAEDADGDGKLDPPGYEIRTGTSTAPVYIDYDGNQRIGAAADSVELALGNFVHVIGSFSFEKGPVHRVDVATGLPANLGDLVVALQDAFGDLPFTDPADGTLWVEPDLSVIHNLEVDSLQIGASGAHIFVGLDGPYYTDTDNDGFVSDETTFNEAAIGFVVDGVDFGFVTMAPTLSALPGFGSILPKFTALTASADQVGFVGIPDVTMALEGIGIDVNTGNKWPLGLGPPVIDFAASFATDELLGFFDQNDNGRITVGDLRSLGGYDLLGIYEPTAADAQELTFEDLLDSDLDANGDGMLQVTEASAIGTGAGGVSAQAADVDGDGKLDPPGYEVRTGTTTAPVYINHDGKQRFAASIEQATLQISQFVHIAGSLAVEKGPVQTVQLAPGGIDLTGNLELLLESFGLDPGLASLLISTQAELEFLTIGASNVHAFIGINGPYWNDTDGDRVLDPAEINDEAVGLVVNDFDFGLAMMTSTNPLLPSKYTALKATAESISLEGIDGATLAAEQLLVEVNQSQPTFFGVSLFPVVDFAETFPSEQLALFDTTHDGQITVAELRALNHDELSYGSLYDASNNPADIISLAVLVSELDTNHDGQLQIGEAAALAGEAAAAAADVDHDGKIDPVGFELKTGGDPVYLTADSSLIRAQGFVELDLFGTVIITGSVAFELGPTLTVDLDDGTTDVLVSTLTIGAANVNAFVGINGPYWTDLDGDHEVSPDELDPEATGLAITDLDIGIMVMTSVSTLDVFLAAKASVFSFGLVGIDGFTAAGSFDIAINQGIGGSGLAAVDFLASFPDSDGTGPDQAGFEVNTGDPSSPILLDFTESVIMLHLEGVLAFAPGGTEVLALDGTFDLTIEDDFFEMRVIATFDLNAGSTRLLAFSADGFLRIDNDGVLAAIHLALAAGVPSSFGFTLEADFHLELNTTGAARPVAGFGSIEPGFRIHADGTLGLAGGAFLLEGTFDLEVGATAVSIQIHAGVRIFGFPFAVDGLAVIQGGSNPGIVLSIVLTVGGANSTTIAAVAGKINLTGRFLFQVNTTGVAVSHAGTNVVPGLRIAVSDAAGTGPATLNILGFVMRGGVTISVTPQGFEIRNLVLSLNFFNFVTFNVTGNLFANGSFNLTAAFNISVGNSTLGASGGASATFSDSGFSASGSFSGRLFGFNVGPIGGSFSISSNRVSLAIRVVISTPAVKIKVFGKTVTLIPAFNFDKTARFFIGTVTPPTAVQAPPDAPPAPLLARQVGTDLFLNIGADAHLRGAASGTTDVTEEVYEVTHVGGSAGDETLAVSAFNETQIFSGIARIVVTDAGVDDDSITIASGVLANAELNGGDDDDELIYSGSGTAILRGGNGFDRLTGGSGVSTLEGGDHDDVLEGLSGTNVIRGGPGNDQILMGAGSYQIFGDEGDDLVDWDIAQGGQLAGLDGATGLDTLRILGTDAAETAQVMPALPGFAVAYAGFVAAPLNTEGLVIEARGGSDTITIGHLAGSALIQIALQLGAGDGAPDSVTLEGSAAADSFVVASQEGEGVDFVGIQNSVDLGIEQSDTDDLLTIRGNGGDDSIDAHLLEAFLINLRLEGNDGADRIIGSQFADVIDGGAGSDTISGEKGVDIFVAFAGPDTDVDTLLERRDADYTLTDHELTISNATLVAETEQLTDAFGNPVFDRVVLIGGPGANAFAVSQWTGHVTLDGEEGGDAYTIELNGAGSSVIIIEDSGMAGTDIVTVQGTDGADVFVLTGDTLTLGTATETLHYSGLEAFTLESFGDDDVITILQTHAGLVTVNTGDGNDTVTVVAISGSTTIDTGAGADVVVVNGPGVGAALAIEDTDGVAFGLDFSAETADLSGTLTSTQITGLGLGGAISYAGVSALGITLGSGNDTFNVQSTHASTPTTLDAGPGNDTINVGSLAPDAGGTVNDISGPLTVNGQGGSDTLNVDDTGDMTPNTGTLTATTLAGLGMLGGITYGTLESVNIGLGSGDDTLNVQSIDATTPTTLNAGLGNDTVNIGSLAGTVNAIGAPLTVNGQGGSDTLNVDDTGDTEANTGTLTATTLTGLGMLRGITYGTLESVNIALGSGGDSFTIASTHEGETTLNGNAGTDTVNVRTTGGATTVNAGSENDTVNVGSLAGTVNGIGAPLTVNGGDGSDTLNVDDTGDTTANTGTLTATTLAGLGMLGGITYGTLESVNIALGSGGDSFTIASTHGGATTLGSNAGADTVNVQTIGGATTVNAGSENDAINVGSLAPAANGTVNGIGALLTVNGGDGSDTLNVDDTGDTTANTGTLTATTLAGLGMLGGITYGALESVNIALGSGGDTFTIASTHGGATTLGSNAGADTVNVRTTGGATTVNAGSENDAINVGSLAPAANGTVNGIGALLTVNGGGDSDTLNVDDTGDMAPNTGTLTATTITGLGLGPDGIAYETVETLNINLGSGSDVFNVQGTSAVTNLSLNAGDDRMFVSSNGVLDELLGTLNIDAGSGRHLLMISDEAATAGDGYVLITDSHARAFARDANVAVEGEIFIAGLAPAAISYRAAAHGNFADGITIWSGFGNDTIEIDGTHFRTDVRTVTTLNTGLGDDQVFVDLQEGSDGFFVLNTQGPYDDRSLSDKDVVDAGQSSLPLIVFGGQDDDWIRGGSGGDLIFGDRGRVLYFTDPSAVTPITAAVDADTLAMLEADAVSVFGHGGLGDKTDGVVRPLAIAISVDREVGGTDTIYGIGGEDILIGGAAGDDVDGGLHDDLIFGDNVGLQRLVVGDMANPRFRVLEGMAIYSTATETAGDVLVTDAWQVDPRGAPTWTDFRITLLDHDLATQSALQNNFGDDYLAGGPHDDQIFGQLGNDVIQGDGDIGLAVGAHRDSDNKLLVQRSEDRADDGDDYIEGNGGSDVIFGNLGQDDIVGGNSSLYSLDADLRRVDAGDRIFGGSATGLNRNGLGDTAPQSHATDADAIVGDNGNIYRIVKKTGPAAFETFNYDDLYDDARGIVPRGMQLIDYTPGGPDFAGATLEALGDIGGNDEIHGESGDDFIYGMKGDDMLFGEGQNDDLIGGWGNDWISGGTGIDGVLGDDGRIYTSRNSSTVPEPLYGIGTVVVNERIDTPGDMQVAIINADQALKKTVDLTPFDLDPDTAFPDPLFDPMFADDIIYGGLGNDFLHGGAGDDAISGAEALPSAVVWLFPDDGLPHESEEGVAVDVGYDTPGNPGHALGFEARRAEEFAAYDEFEPRVKILIGDEEFFLNFDAGEGPVVAGTPVFTDGDDAIFGDLGNDWLVGGTGRDHVFGGRGNDLMNADDDHETNAGQNDQPDGPQLSYEDIAFGGAGRDVLIGNTGGDRLIDWAGEFNSYLVPFPAFGSAAISRSLQPQLKEYLYDLSAADGADATRFADTGTGELRNGEPDGEIGLVEQKDPDWQAQTGAPNDMQPGNVPGGARDVLRGATFNNGQADGFSADSGTWKVSGGRFEVAPEYLGGDATSVFYVDHVLPIYFEIRATINAGKPTAGYKSNAYLIFDYQSESNFKFAGVNISTDKIEMGYRDAGGWHVVEQANIQVRPDRDYNLLLALNGTVATLVVDNSQVFSHVYAPRVDPDGFSYGLNAGMVGIGAYNAIGRIDNVAVQILPPEITFQDVEDFDDGAANLYIAGKLGDWQLSAGRYDGAPALAEDLGDSLADLHIGANYLLRFDAELRTNAIGGILFDRYAPDDFKFAALSTETNQVLIGHYTDRHGWKVDAAVGKLLDANRDYTLTVTLKGSTVSLYLDNNALLGHVFNAVTVDGDFGLLTRNGTTSFDAVTVATNDRSLQAESATASNLLAASAPDRNAPPAEPLDPAALAAVVDSAIARWRASGLLDEALFAALDAVTFEIADLPGLVLASTVGNTVYLDADAAGFGWFVDASLANDEEFARRAEDGSLVATAGSEAYGRMDLLTVVMHEIGHVLGFDHDAPDTGALMEETLDAGTRRLPGAAAVTSAGTQSVGAGSDTEHVSFDASASSSEAVADRQTHDTGQATVSSTDASGTVAITAGFQAAMSTAQTANQPSLDSDDSAPPPTAQESTSPESGPASTEDAGTPDAASANSSTEDSGIGDQAVTGSETTTSQPPAAAPGANGQGRRARS